MQHYTLVTRRDDSKEAWRACAVLSAGSLDQAARQAKALRGGGGLAFVPSPSRFRLRRSSRFEMALLVGFFRNLGQPMDAYGSDADADASFARRERLLRSFFLGLYIDPDSVRRRYAPVSPPAGASGGVETGDDGMHQEISVEAEDEGVAASPVAAPVLPKEPVQASDDGPLGSDNQEDALSAILNSAEANDGGQSREESFDLDIL